MSAERVHQLDQGHPSPKSEESGHDSGQSVHVEFLGDDQAVTSQKSVLPRCGSLREQFAALLKAHFATTMEAQAAAVESGVAPADAPFPRPAGGRFRGVTKHKRTQRYEAHIWQCKKQLYLGGFDSEILAAKSHDIMALRCKGLNCDILNFPSEHYDDLAPFLEKLSSEDIVTALRNYSKAQTAARVGSLTSPSQLSLTHSLKSAGVQKPRPRPMRRQSLGSAPSSPLASPLRRLSLSTPRRRPSRVELSEGEEEEEEPGLDESWEYAGNQAGVAAPSSQGLGRVPRWGSGAKLHPAALLPGALDAYSTRSRHSCPQGMHPAAAPLAAPAVPAVVSPFQDSAMVKLPSLNVGGRDACTVPVEELDSVDLNSMLNHLVGEDLSLTYSASDESYLFESVPMDATHTALEHLSGVVLYTESPSPPDSPTSAFNGGPATEQGWFLEGTGPQREEHCSHAARQRAPHSALHASPFAAANFAGCFV